MQLKAIKTDGILRWSGLEDDFAKELALDLDEEPDNVAVTLQYLLSTGLAETENNIDFFFPFAVENTGSEGASAKRVREYRAKQTLQCNADVTQVKRIGNGEIEKEIEKEKDTRDRDREVTPLELAMDEFVKFRKAMKKPLTDKGRELTLQELEKLAPGNEELQIAILNQSIQRGWQGVFPLKEQPKAVVQQGPRTQAKAIADLMEWGEKHDVHR